ncbi:MAG: aminotransferase class I/II-fold pyridoxal phosphate-dependent enzyme [Crocinitomix sp.]|nr:aminotransferase class I/II-fold pyridoxal phosphate-dependent enzyme [Crocinitomix sp.]
MIKSKLPKVGTTIFSVMSALANEHGAVNLSQGFPDFPIDERLKSYIVEALDKNQVQYAPMPGRLDLREAICDKVQMQHGVSIDSNTEITVTAGATQAIYTAITAIINEGDEVILFDPAYDCYDPTIRVNKGIPIHLKLVHPTYHINWDEVRQKVNANTKLIITNNPHNPCGSVWTKEDLAELESLVQANPQLMVLSDEVYEHIQYADEHQSVLKSEILRERSFVTYSFGKSMHVTGWKLGYCIAPKNFTAEFRKVHQYLVFCANNTMQYAVAKYLNTGQFWKDVMPMYRKKKDLFLNAIKASRFKALECSGTYFCLLDYSDISTLTDVEFAKELTIKHGVAAIPVSVFYEDQTDHKVIRICFAKQDETLIKAASLLCKI